jgi:deoxyribodipyrimidine photo-lyase
MQKMINSALVWFRRDLRAHDHAALHAACRAAKRVHCLFVFDTNILEALPRIDRRVEFIRESLLDLDRELRALGLQQGEADAGLIVAHGCPVEQVPAWATKVKADAVFASHDDEPAALSRDAAVAGKLREHQIAWRTVRDHVIFERDEILTAAGKPYSVFTPYKQAWLKALTPERTASLDPAEGGGVLAPQPAGAGTVPSLEEIGFRPSDLAQLPLPTGSRGGAQLLADFVRRMDRYAATRDFPAAKGPSYLSTHLRFGTVSIRELVRAAAGRASAGSEGAAVWLSELIWRDFYHQILFHHPRVTESAFRPEFADIEWFEGPQADACFSCWCEGRTGYPLVDAAMLQLLRTGYMHNRLRMLSASFLVKDLGIDWRKGEAWFARHLNDFDLAANNGGWQWAASTGCDSQPYFRIFNPVTQSQRFDPEGKFIRRYLPQLQGLSAKDIHAPWLAKPLELAAAEVRLGENYPFPIVDHAAARALTLARFSAARQRAEFPPDQEAASAP